MRMAAVLLAFMTMVPEQNPRPADREALRPFNDLIGGWRGTGQPEGNRQEKQKGFWTESLDWSWQFKGNDAWLKLTIDQGKYFTEGELRPLPEKDRYRLILTTPGKERQVFEGRLEDKVLTVEHSDASSRETQRLVLTFLHANRFLYRFEKKAANRSGFVKLYQVGATKKDVPFAGPADTTPECIVSGGKGTMSVTHQGKTYYVCCSGCRDAFKDDPEKFIKEAQEKKGKK